MTLAVPKLNVKGEFELKFAPLSHKFGIDLKIGKLLPVWQTFLSQSLIPSPYLLLPLSLSLSLSLFLSLLKFGKFQPPGSQCISILILHS